MRTQCQRPDCAEPAAVAYRFDAARQMVILDQLHGSLDAEGGALCARHAARMVLPRGWWLDDRRQAVPTLFAALKMQMAEQSTELRRRRVVAPRRSPEAPRGAVVRRRRGQSPVSEAPVIVDVAPVAPVPKVTVPPPVAVAAVVPPVAVAVPANVPADGPLTIEALVERFMADSAPVEPVVAESVAVESVEAEPVAVESVAVAPVDTPPVIETPKPLWTPDFDAQDDLGGLLNATSPLLSRAFSGRSTPRTRRAPGPVPAPASE